jgi:hypothetical protein
MTTDDRKFSAYLDASGVYNMPEGRDEFQAEITFEAGGVLIGVIHSPS